MIVGTVISDSGKIIEIWRDNRKANKRYFEIVREFRAKGRSVAGLNFVRGTVTPAALKRYGLQDPEVGP